VEDETLYAKVIGEAFPIRFKNKKTASVELWGWLQVCELINVLSFLDGKRKRASRREISIFIHWQ